MKKADDRTRLTLRLPRDVRVALGIRAQTLDLGDAAMARMILRMALGRIMEGEEFRAAMANDKLDETRDAWLRERAIAAEELRADEQEWQSIEAYAADHEEAAV